MTDTNELFTKIKEIVARNAQLEAMASHAKELEAMGERLLFIAGELRSGNVSTDTTKSTTHKFVTRKIFHD